MTLSALAETQHPRRILAVGITDVSLTPNAFPFEIATFQGDSSKIGFVDPFNDQVGSFTPAGAVTAFKVPPQGGDVALPVTLTAGGDHNLWFLYQLFKPPPANTPDGWGIGSMSPAGAFNFHPVLSVTACSINGCRLVWGPDSNLWISEFQKVGRLNPTTGAFTEFNLPSSIDDIVAGTDGNLYGVASHNLIRITTAGQVTALPAVPGNSALGRAAVGSNGLFYLTDAGNNAIVEVNLSGAATSFPIPSGSGPTVIGNILGNISFGVGLPGSNAGKLGSFNVSTRMISEQDMPSGDAVISIAPSQTTIPSSYLVALDLSNDPHVFSVGNGSAPPETTLSVSKTVSKADAAALGDEEVRSQTTLFYEVKVTNTGPNPAIGFGIYDYWGSDGTYAGPRAVDCTDNATSTAFDCYNPGSLAPGASVTYEVPVLFTNEEGHPLVVSNIAIASASNAPAVTSEKVESTLDVPRINPARLILDPVLLYK
ncbi:MAG TPA: hypothetical protein VKE50_02040 [Thermoanaerobaculia bacterium]|nr:hypothetical protein [Thermoanaerobaculia bacterium]